MCLTQLGQQGFDARGAGLAAHEVLNHALPKLLLIPAKTLWCPQS
jgi:hypothetical protein